jgi:glycosyltransferase involved in cell wall biosynthesis
MCPVGCTYDLLKKYGFKKLRFIRWAVDDQVFLPEEKTIKPPIRFIHNAGYGGARWRKNTLAVVKAFNIVCQKRRDVVLILKTQKPISEYPEKVRDIISDNGRIRVVEKDLTMADLIGLYRSCHVSVLPSKWEGIGIPFIESLALGLPVVTLDAPPMNEWARDGYNGLTARIDGWEQRKDRKLLVKGALVDVDDLAKQMLNLADIKLIERLSRNAVKSTRNIKKRFTKETEKLIRSVCEK